MVTKGCMLPCFVDTFSCARLRTMAKTRIAREVDEILASTKGRGARASGGYLEDPSTALIRRSLAATTRFSSPRRVEILKSSGSYFRPGQFGYALSRNVSGERTLDEGDLEEGDPSYYVSKTPGGEDGGEWFSSRGIRFTGR